MGWGGVGWGDWNCNFRPVCSAFSVCLHSIWYVVNEYNFVITSSGHRAEIFPQPPSHYGQSLKWGVDWCVCACVCVCYLFLCALQ